MCLIRPTLVVPMSGLESKFWILSYLNLTEKFHDWTSLLENMVHNNDHFTLGQKLYFLHTSLIDDAADILLDTMSTLHYLKIGVFFSFLLDYPQIYG